MDLDGFHGMTTRQLRVLAPGLTCGICGEIGDCLDVHYSVPEGESSPEGRRTFDRDVCCNCMPTLARIPGIRMQSGPIFDYRYSPALWEKAEVEPPPR